MIHVNRRSVAKPKIDSCRIMAGLTGLDKDAPEIVQHKTMLPKMLDNIRFLIYNQNKRMEKSSIFQHLLENKCFDLFNFFMLSLGYKHKNIISQFYYGLQTL